MKDESLKKLSVQPGEQVDEGNFTLVSHLENNLTVDQSVECIAQHFARISQEFPPFSLSLMPEHVKSKITEPPNLKDLPDISEHVVYGKIKRSKKTRSSVPGDLPRRIAQEFAPELAAPARKIFYNILRTGE